MLLGSHRVASPPVTTTVELARHQWEEGYRRLRATTADPRRHERLTAQVDILVDELRRRLGQVFTLRELTDEYESAERWTRDAVAASFPSPHPGDLSTAEDSAFHLYARGARDFAP